MDEIGDVHVPSCSRSNPWHQQRVMATDEKCPERRNPPITLFRVEDDSPACPVMHAMCVGSSAASNFDVQDRVRIDGVGYDAYSTEWPLQLMQADIFPGRTFTRRSIRRGGSR
jgi:hypothetical protein